MSSSLCCVCIVWWFVVVECATCWFLVAYIYRAQEREFHSHFAHSILKQNLGDKIVEEFIPRLWEEWRGILVSNNYPSIQLSTKIKIFLYLDTNWNKFNCKGEAQTTTGEPTQNRGDSRNNTHLRPKFSNDQLLQVTIRPLTHHTGSISLRTFT